MSTPRVIGLASDRPGCGKSTAARYIEDHYGFRVHSIGESVKMELDAMLSVHGFRYEEKNKEDFRDGLIWWTEFRLLRTSPDYWLNTLTRAVRHGDRIVVSDVRYPSEADYIRSIGGILLGIVRLSSAIHTARAENAMNNYDFNWVVDNSGYDGGAEMFRQLDNILAALKYAKFR